ncbi:MAG: hypothetical protein ACI9CB_002580 [Rhodothermales bacterium]|jgi:hypothetical protein
MKLGKDQTADLRKLNVSGPFFRFILIIVLAPDSDPCLFYQSISKLATHDGSMMYSSASPDIAVTM